MRQRCPVDCPLCYANVRARSNYKGHKGFRQPRRPPTLAELKMFLKKPVAMDSSVSNRDYPWTADLMFTERAALGEFLSVTKWDDGSERVTGTMTLFCEAGCLKACLSDKELKRVLFMTADSLEALLDSLEAALESGRADWRAVSQSAGGRRSK